MCINKVVAALIPTSKEPIKPGPCVTATTSISETLIPASLIAFKNSCHVNNMISKQSRYYASIDFMDIWCDKTTCDKSSLSSFKM